MAKKWVVAGKCIEGVQDLVTAPVKVSGSSPG